jgi:hypothetical protein
MRVVEIADDLVLGKLLRPDPNRTQGLHLSDITGDLMRQLEPNRFGGDIRHEFIGIGQAVEDVIGDALAHRVMGFEKPGEFRDRETGIYMTPDAYPPLREIKVTWVKGLPGPEALHDPKLLRYHLQGKSYCRVLGTQQILFHVLFITGNKGGVPLPVLRTFQVTYSRHEIEDTWRQVLQHAADVPQLRARLRF